MSTKVKTKYEIIEIDSVEVTVDVSLLTKSDELFFNATEISKQFGKRPDDFWKQQQNREYLDALITLYGGNKDSYVCTKTGRIYGGTWFHRDLALQFARWLSPIFAVNLDKWIQQRIEEEHERKQKRLESKTGYLPLTDAVQAAHSNPRDYHYMNEANLINRLVTGMTAKKFKEVHGVDNVRDALTAAQIREIEMYQRQNTSLIELGFSYEERKRLLQQQVDKAA